MGSRDLTAAEYAEPVYYCKACHSMHVVQDDSMANPDWDGTYCGKCFSTDIEKEMFGEWLEEEEVREQKRAEKEWSR